MKLPRARVSAALLIAAVANFFSVERALAAEPDTARALAEFFQAEPKHPLRSTYERLTFAPLWSGDAARGAAAAALFRATAGAAREGIEPGEYPLAKVAALAAYRPEGWTARELAALDLALTDLFLRYAGDQMFGRVAPNSHETRKLRKHEQQYLANILVGAAARGDPQAAVNVVYPFAPDYLTLVGALAHYREIAYRGGWRQIPARIMKIKPGTQDPSVTLLRLRLISSGDLAADTTDTSTIGLDYFGPELESALRAFQLRHSLEPDGKVGAATFRELNVSAGERARQIELNLERRRWVGRGFGERYVLVNIPTFMLRAVENKETKLISKVIVGTKKTPTPFVNTKIAAIEFNPDWYVPKNIQNNEVIPEAQKDTTWLHDRGIRVYYGDGKDAVEVDPSMIDWAAVEGGNYHFRQPPGPGNALGRLKLVTPNPLDVYLHDTPQRNLFNKSLRAFSHGCVRVEEPLLLAAWALDDPKWTEASIIEELDTKRSTTIKVKNPPDVYLVYWTVWADESGVLRFAPDLYGEDKKLDDDLSQLASRVVSTAQDALRTTRSATLPKRM